MNGPNRLPYREAVLANLLATPTTVAGDPNRSLLASIIAGQITGTGCLPAHLGLSNESYLKLMTSLFPGFDLPPVTREIESIPEWGDLKKLLLDDRAGEHDSEPWMADIVATACAGRDHLWQDLGLLNRDELTQLMWVNFPALARANTGDMKWKKFLYRQFCSREGIYVCPAPSCGECKDYAKCFGPEN